MVRQCLLGVPEAPRWVNITPPAPNGRHYALWTLLPVPQPPAHYWFMCEGVSMHPVFGLTVALKVLR